jgi:UDP-3-O-[3-hydroxymyristoyl] glucosamine N-acyltransferase
MRADRGRTRCPLRSRPRKSRSRAFERRRVHPAAIVAKSANIGKDVAIGPGVVVGEHCRIGDNATLYPGVVLYDDVKIGNNSVLHANVVVREQCNIGANVIVHSGTVIGSDGFGFAPKQDGSYEKIPQRGIVVVEDDVEIGANCAIDRATIGETRIRRGAKLDNLIQIAHNVVIGEHTVIAGQTGVSGSTKIGRNCVIAGQVGFAGHLQIADRSTFGAQSGVSRSLLEAGKTYFGYPAKEHRQAFRIEGALRQLPELLVEIRDLQKRVEELESQIKEHSTVLR